MKIKSIIYVAVVSVFFSCKENEMQLSKSDVSVLTEIENHSPIYIDLKEEKMEVNSNNKIGNTNWIFNVSKSLRLISVVSEVKNIVEKKYAEKIHGDTLGVYFSYSDTIHNKLNFLPFKDVVFKNKPIDTNDIRPNLMAFQENKSFYFKNKLYDFEDIERVFNEVGNETVTLVFHPHSTFETYIQIKTKLQKYTNLNKAEYFY